VATIGDGGTLAKKLNDKAMRGIASITEMLGENVANQMQRAATANRFGSRLTALALEVCYGDHWNEAPLTRRERSLLLIAALIVLRQPDELRNHLRLGVANGVKPDEFECVLMHLLPYIGFPATSIASKVMREFVKDEPEQGGSG
jgi:4-carboxymuconolactone decarboxylase